MYWFSGEWGGAKVSNRWGARWSHNHQGASIIWSHIWSSHNLTQSHNHQGASSNPYLFPSLLGQSLHCIVRFIHIAQLKLFDPNNCSYIFNTLLPELYLHKSLSIEVFIKGLKLYNHPPSHQQVHQPSGDQMPASLAKDTGGLSTLLFYQTFHSDYPHHLYYSCNPHPRHPNPCNPSSSELARCLKWTARRQHRRRQQSWDTSSTTWW